DAAEDERAERAHQEPGGVGRKRGQQRRGIVSRGKEERGEEGGERRVEIEVVPFEHGTERGSEDDATFVACHPLRRLAGQRQRGHGNSPEVRGAWDAGRTGEPARGRHAIAAHNLRPFPSGRRPKVGTAANVLIRLAYFARVEALRLSSAIGRTPNVALHSFEALLREPR